eukprot:jgi/Undpi1/10695/HiC_scaffold_29.g13143.m1
MGIKVFISLERQECVAGDVVEGLVQVEVPASKTEGISAERLTLRLVGLAKTRVKCESGSGKNKSETVYNDGDEFLSYNIQLASFGGTARPGSHSFPFSVMLPPDLPASMKESYFNGECSVAYTFEARLHRPGLLKFNVTAKSDLKVLGKPQEVVAAAPVLVGPETERVKACCCFNKGSMSIGFEADRSVVAVNECLGLTIIARNDSSTIVKNMHVEILQECTWFAHGHRERVKRSVAAITVERSHLGEVMHPVGEGEHRGRSATAVESAARMHLQELLAGDAGTRYELQVPNNCLLTLESSLIKVKHFLRVRLKTPICINSPDIRMPLRVHAGVRLGGQAPPEASPVGLPSVGGVPYAAATVGEGSSRGGVGSGVVSVPQSAVTMEFSSDLPRPSAPPAK